MGRLGENIHKRKDGRWEARVVSGDPVCGRTSYKYIYGHSYQEAKTKKKELLERKSFRETNQTSEYNQQQLDGRQLAGKV